MTAILVSGFLVCVAATVGFGIGWYIGHEEGMDDMACRIDAESRRRSHA